MATRRTKPSAEYSPSPRGPTSYTNQNGNVWLYGYDGLNRRTNEVCVGVTTNAFAYDGAGDFLALTDGSKQTTSWNYDQYGRATNKLDAAQNVIFRFGYDDDNRLTNRWTPAKGTTVYGYDAVGNLTGVTYSTSPSISMSYDADNRLTNMVDGIGPTAYSYDQVGQLLSEGGLWMDDTVNYTYTNRLRMELTLVHPSGTPWAMDYRYDDSHRLTNVESSAGGFSYTYDPVKLQRVGDLGLPDGAYITNTFDSVARLLNTALVGSAGTNLDSQNYVYNTAGQRTSETNTAGDYRNYVYDNEGELIKTLANDASGSNRLQEQFAYVYDAAGNLRIKTNNALAQFFMVNNLNELTIETNSGKLTVAGTTTSAATNVTVNGLIASRYADATFALGGFTVTNGTNEFTAIGKDSLGNSSTNSITVFLPATNNYTYDLNGNLTNDGARYFTYDDENQLIGIWVSNAWSNSFAYDGKRRRRIERDYTWAAGTSSWQETNEIHFIYDGIVVVEERNASNVPLVSYTRGSDFSGSLQGAGGIGGLLARTTYGQEVPGAPASAFYHADGNGNITALMYPGQQLAAKYLYDPFGNTLAQSGPLMNFNRYRFSSEEWVDNSGLYYYLYRFYDPSLQRWVNRDPSQDDYGNLSKGDLNDYTFVKNGPLQYFDLLGLDREPDISWAPASCPLGEKTIFIQTLYGGYWPYRRPRVDDGSAGFGVSGNQGCPDYPGVESDGVFQDSPSGFTGPVHFITCRVCLKPCCAGEWRIASVGPCVYWKKGDLGDLSDPGFTKVSGTPQTWEVALDHDYPAVARGSCYKCLGKK